MCDVCVISYAPLALLALSLFKHLQIHVERLLNGVFGDKADKVLDVGLPVGCELVDGWLPHHGLGDLSGVVCKVNRSTVSALTPEVELGLHWALNEFWMVLRDMTHYNNY